MASSLLPRIERTITSTPIWDWLGSWKLEVSIDIVRPEVRLSNEFVRVAAELLTALSTAQSSSSALSPMQWQSQSPRLGYIRPEFETPALGTLGLAIDPMSQPIHHPIPNNGKGLQKTVVSPARIIFPQHGGRGSHPRLVVCFGLAPRRGRQLLNSI